MKRLALLALLLAAPVAAQERASLMLVRPPVSTQVNTFTEALGWQVIQSICKEWDIDYVIVPYQATNTVQLRAGQQIMSDRTTLVSHDGVIIPNWVRGRWSKADSLTLAARWPTVDVYFAGLAASTGMADAAGCSTGIRSVNGDGDAHNTHLIYEVNGTAAWRGFSDYDQAAASTRTGGAYGESADNIAANGQATWSGRGIWRPLIGTASGVADSSDIDGSTVTLQTFTRRADPDSVAAWYRQPTTSAGAPTGARVYFSNFGGLALALPPVDVITYVIAKMDSSIYARTGKRLINRRVKAGIYVERWMASGDYSVSSTDDTLDAGPFNPNDVTHDSLNIQASLDSLGSLDVPITFCVEIDSLDHPAFQWQEVAMRTRVPKFRVAWQSYAGTAATGMPASYAAGAGKMPDVWGHARARRLIPDNYSGSLNPESFNLGDCPGLDSSIFCLAARADSLLHARYGAERVDHLVYAARDDWTPKTIDRTGSGKIDSLMAVAHAAHVKGFKTNADAGLYADPGRVRSGPPFGYGIGRTEFPVYENVRRTTGTGVFDTGNKLATLVTVPTRNTTLPNTRANQYLIDHDYRQETNAGLWMREWYFDNSIRVLYHHNFQVRPLLFEVDANSLGARGGRFGKLIRNGLWAAFWQARVFAALNRAAGHTVAEIVEGEDLAR